jgi:hypothetical protein
MYIRWFEVPSQKRVLQQPLHLQPIIRVLFKDSQNKILGFIRNFYILGKNNVFVYLRLKTQLQSLQAPARFQSQRVYRQSAARR